MQSPCRRTSCTRLNRVVSPLRPDSPAVFASRPTPSRIGSASRRSQASSRLSWSRSSAARASPIPTRSWPRRGGRSGRTTQGEPGARGRLGPGAHDRRADRAGQGDHTSAPRARDGHAPLDGRAGQRRPDGDGDPGAGRPGDQLHRGPDRHRHRQLPHQGPDPEHLDRADGPGARRGQDRHRRRLPGGRRELQHHDPRPGRLGHDGRGPGRRARGRRLRDLHRRRRRLHDRPPDRPRGAEDRPDQLRRDARAGQPGGGGDALAVDRVRQEVRRADPRPELVHPTPRGPGSSPRATPAGSASRVTGAALAKDEARITILGVPDRPGVVHTDLRQRSPRRTSSST